jgi:glutamate-ammonia-ligase adenylyltransferase
MVDIEFIVQFLVLGYAHQYPQLIGNLGNIALLNIAGNVGLIDPPLAQSVGDAYRILRSRQHRLRLDGAEKTRIQLDSEPELAASRNVVQKLWLEIFKAPSDL